MRRSRSRRQGFTLVLVMLVTLVAVATTASVATITTRSGRVTSRAELQSSQALFAAESGLSSLLARSRAIGFEGIPSPAPNGDCCVSLWLAATGLDDYRLPDGARVQLAVVAENPVTGVVTIRAVGTSANGAASRVALQDFEVRFDTTTATVSTLASLVTKTAIRANSAQSAIIGLPPDQASWHFPGTLANTVVGDVVIGNPYGTAEPGRYRVIAATSTTRTLRAIADGEERTSANLSLSVDIVPFNVGLPVSAASGSPSPPYEADAPPSHLAVSQGGAFAPGQEVRVCGRGLPCTDPSHDNVGVVGEGGWDPETHALPVAWSIWQHAIDDGATVRTQVASAVAEGGCPTRNLDRFPQGCVDSGESAQLGDLWANTFGGISKIELRDVAQRLQNGETVPGWEGKSGAYYGARSWPSSVVGLTWIDGADTRGLNNALCGSGIVVLNTGASLDEPPNGSLNLTTSRCSFDGILYVIGQLRLVGNLSGFSGAVYIEGPGGVTEIQGTGTKSLYNPIAIRSALNTLPSDREFRGLFAAIDRSWRIGTQP